MVVMDQIYNLPIANLSKATIADIQNSFNELNDYSQKIWDEKIQACVDMQAFLVNRAQKKYDKLSGHFMYYDSNLTEEAAVAMAEEHCLSHVEDRKNEG